MSIIAWNYRGLGRSSAVRGLRGFVLNHSLTGLFLCETKSHKERLEQLGRRLNFDNSFFVEAEGSKGGLALFWKSCWK